MERRSGGRRACHNNPGWQNTMKFKYKPAAPEPWAGDQHTEAAQEAALRSHEQASLRTVGICAFGATNAQLHTHATCPKLLSQTERSQPAYTLRNLMLSHIKYTLRNLMLSHQHPSRAQQRLEICMQHPCPIRRKPWILKGASLVNHGP